MVLTRHLLAFSYATQELITHNKNDLKGFLKAVNFFPQDVEDEDHGDSLCYYILDNLVNYNYLDFDDDYTVKNKLEKPKEDFEIIYMLDRVKEYIKSPKKKQSISEYFEYTIYVEEILDFLYNYLIDFKEYENVTHIPEIDILRLYNLLKNEEEIYKNINYKPYVNNLYDKLETIRKIIGEKE